MKIAAALLIIQIGVMFFCYVKRCRTSDYIGETFCDVFFTVAAISAVALAVRFFMEFMR